MPDQEPLRPTLAGALLAELKSDPGVLEELRGMLKLAEDDRWLTTVEAADRLNIHPRTCVRAAAAGRVVGAERTGSHMWRYRASILQLLPPIATDIGSAGAGRGRRPGKSTTVSAIAGTDKKAA